MKGGGIAPAVRAWSFFFHILPGKASGGMSVFVSCGFGNMPDVYFKFSCSFPYTGPYCKDFPG